MAGFWPLPYHAVKRGRRTGVRQAPLDTFDDGIGDRTAGGGARRPLSLRSRHRGRAVSGQRRHKSNPQAIPDLQSGLLTFMMIDIVNAKIAIERGALKGLFLTDTERYPRLPDLPTAAEAHLPDVLARLESMGGAPN
jgi:hypothetical protein